MTTVRLPSPEAGSASSPIDFVSAVAAVQVRQGLLSEMMFTLIDLLMHYGFIRAAEANRGLP
jgi:hypothetical protein